MQVTLSGQLALEFRVILEIKFENNLILDLRGIFRSRPSARNNLSINLGCVGAWIRRIILMLPERCQSSSTSIRS
jgi:hypothetical protein